MNKGSNTIAASEMLLEELTADIARVSAAGASAFTAGQFEMAAHALDKAQQLTAPLADLRAVSEHLQSVLADLDEQLQLDSPQPTTLHEPPDMHDGTRDAPRFQQPDIPAGKVRRRTPESAFAVPILRSLIVLGGRASAKAVLARVHRQVEASLGEADLVPLKSGEPRWRNTARWERKRLIDKGLLRRDSPKGVWEISDEGRAWLARQNEEIR